MAAIDKAPSVPTLASAEINKFEQTTTTTCSIRTSNMKDPQLRLRKRRCKGYSTLYTYSIPCSMNSHIQCEWDQGTTHHEFLNASTRKCLSNCPCTFKNNVTVCKCQPNTHSLACHHDESIPFKLRSVSRFVLRITRAISSAPSESRKQPTEVQYTESRHKINNPYDPSWVCVDLKMGGTVGLIAILQTLLGFLTSMSIWPHTLKIEYHQCGVHLVVSSAMLLQLLLLLQVQLRSLGTSNTTRTES